MTLFTVLLSKITYPTAHGIEYHGLNTQSEAAEWGALAAGGISTRMRLPVRLVCYHEARSQLCGSHQALEQDLVTIPSGQQRQFSLLQMAYQKTTTVTTKDLIRSGVQFQTVYSYLLASFR